MSNKIEAKSEAVKLTDITTGKVKVTEEQLRRIVEEAHVEGYEGRLFIDEKYKTPGKRLRIDNIDAATHQHLTRLGYVPKIDPDMKAGGGSLSEPSSMGSHIYIEQSVNGQAQPGMVYEIDEDLYQMRKKIEAEKNNELLEQKIDDSGYDGMDKRRIHKIHK